MINTFTTITLNIEYQKSKENYKGGGGHFLKGQRVLLPYSKIILPTDTKC